MTSKIFESNALESTAASFSALGDPIRLRILDMLGGGMRCVCELREQIDVAPNLLSYHLKVLREAGLVEATRRGRWMDYHLADAAMDRLREAIPSVSDR